MSIRTHREIAAELGISRQRVYQIEQQAIAKIALAIAEDRVLCAKESRA